MRKVLPEVSLDKADAVIDGFVFQGRVIVFSNLLASFVQITSFLTYFPPAAPTSPGKFLEAPLSGRQPPSPGRALARGDPVAATLFCLLCRYPERPRS